MPSSTSQWLTFSTCFGSASITSQVIARAVTVGQNWTTRGGRYVRFSVFSDADGCSVPLCQNNLTDPDPTACAFTHKADHSTYYILMQAPLGAPIDNTITFTATSTPISQTIPRKMPQTLPLKNSQCPPQAISLRAFVRTEGPISVINSGSNTEQWSQFEVPVCNSFGNGFVYSLQARDTASAFATYICKSTPCNDDNLWKVDPSGSASNGANSTDPVTAPFFYLHCWIRFRKPLVHRHVCDRTTSRLTIALTKCNYPRIRKNKFSRKC